MELLQTCVDLLLVTYLWAKLEKPLPALGKADGGHQAGSAHCLRYHPTQPGCVVLSSTLSFANKMVWAMLSLHSNLIPGTFVWVCVQELHVCRFRSRSALLESVASCRGTREEGWRIGPIASHSSVGTQWPCGLTAGPFIKMA